MTNDPAHAPIRVLFVCADNSARSPMAEAILRSLGRGHFHAFSAGLEPARDLDPLAAQILGKHGISADGFVPKSLEAFEGHTFDHVVTLCDRSREQVPVVPGADVMNWSFADPEQALEEHTDPHPFEHLFAGLAQRIRLLMIVSERHPHESPAAAGSG